MTKIKISLNDKGIVNDMLKDSKFTIHSLAVALGGATSVGFREKLVNQMNSCIDEHFQLSDRPFKKNGTNLTFRQISNYRKSYNVDKLAVSIQ